MKSAAVQCDASLLLVGARTALHKAVFWDGLETDSVIPALNNEEGQWLHLKLSSGLTLAAVSRWNSPDFKGAFYDALIDKIKDDVASCDDLKTMNPLIDLTIRLNNGSQEQNNSG